MEYRPEVDGLRALAVIPVLLFHARVPGFSGGYIGVDIFFVISGYLITSLILAGLGTGGFSLISFYERRARRILPALLLVVITCAPFAYFWMLPEDYSLFLKSIVGVSLFASNIVFWRNVDYFNPVAEEQPLLHTWSLGVEEQFYIVFPLVLILCWRSRLLLTTVCIAGFLVSLGISEVLSVRHSSLNFYHLPSRFWELLSGALVAIWLKHRTCQNYHSEFVRACGGIVGILCLAYSITMFGPSTPVPGLWILIPVVGTVLIIIFSHTNSKDRVSRFLTTPWIVYIGTVSYSLYLWHQPLLAFARIRLIQSPPLWLNCLLLVVAFIIAMLSHHYVERRFRGSVAGVERRTLCVSGASLAVLLLVPLGTLASGIGMNRFSDEVVKLSHSENYNNPDLARCRGVRVEKHCSYLDVSQSPDGQRSFFAIWGDSHADQLMPMFINIGSSLGMGVKEFAYPGCAPVLHFQRLDLASVDCSDNPGVLDYILKNDEIRVVVLHAYWEHYIDKANAKDGLESIEEGLDMVVRLLNKSGKSVLIVGPVPRFYVNPRLALAKALHFNLGLEPTLPLHQFYKETRMSRQVLSTVASRFYGVSYLDLAIPLCGNGVCRSVYADQMIYRDSNHLAPVVQQVIGAHVEADIVDLLSKSSVTVKSYK